MTEPATPLPPGALPGFTPEGQPDPALPSYSRGQLALRNGQDRDEIWIAFRGVIYDVTQSRMWRNGKHYEHWSGQDLTPELADAPHSARVFERLAPVGRLV